MNTNYLSSYYVVKQHQSEMERSAQQDLEFSLANDGSSRGQVVMHQVLNQIGQLWTRFSNTFQNHFGNAVTKTAIRVEKLPKPVLVDALKVPKPL